MLMLRRTTSADWVLRAAMALASLVPARALAQERDPAGAQALFDQARELSKKGRYDEACPKFLESNRLDPGIGTQFRLAECYEQSGKIATAWATYLDVASVARSSSQPDREMAATKHATQLEPRLPKLVVNVPDASRMAGLEVHRDGFSMGAVQWGAPVPVDPGAHEITVSAPGHKTLQKTVQLEEGKRLIFEVPALEVDDTPAKVAPAPIASEPPPTSQAVPAPGQPALPPETQTSKSNVDALPIVLGAAGVVGLGVGGIFALKAVSTNKQSKNNCDGSDPNQCSPTGISQRNDARSQGNISTVGMIAGGAFLIASVITWRIEAASAKSTANAGVGLRASAAVVPGSAALYLQGGF
jgi:PEGA domain